MGWRNVYGQIGFYPAVRQDNKPHANHMHGSRYPIYTFPEVADCVFSPSIVCADRQKMSTVQAHARRGNNLDWKV